MLQKMLTASGSLTPKQALSITMRVCDALACAHDHGVIHRDIKPSNIMVDGTGAVKVADFGLAKIATDDASLVTGSHTSIGTPNFIAPEAMSGMGHVDHRADLYAVGVMLYQMLTGELPRGRFDLPSIHTPGLDARFDTVVDRAMQKNPEKRYSTAIEMRTDLERIQSGSKVAETGYSGDGPGRPSTAMGAVDSRWEAGAESPAYAAGHSQAGGGLSDRPPAKPRGALYAGFAGAAVVLIVGAVLLIKHKGNQVMSTGTPTPQPTAEHRARRDARAEECIAPGKQGESFRKYAGNAVCPRADRGWSQRGAARAFQHLANAGAGLRAVCGGAKCGMAGASFSQGRATCGQCHPG